MQMRPATTPTTKAVPVAADVPRRQRRSRVSAVPDKERIGRQAACSVDDKCVCDERECEGAEVGRTVGVSDKEAQREVAEARYALVRHTPAEASDRPYQSAPAGMCCIGWCVSGDRGHPGTPNGERPDRRALCLRSPGVTDGVLYREAVNLQQPRDTCVQTEAGLICLPRLLAIALP